MFTPFTKLAEPSPPDGVSSKEWDRILQESAPSMQNAVQQLKKEAVSGKWVLEKATKGAKGADSRRLQKAVHKFDILSRSDNKIRAGKANLAKTISETERQKRPALNQLPKLKKEGEAAFLELTAENDVSGLDAIALHKVASCIDKDLLKTATALTDSLDEALTLYEMIGGTFEKIGFGAPMFSPPQMAGSPAVSAAKGMGMGSIGGPPKPAGGMGMGGMSAPAPKLPAPPQAQTQQNGVPMTTTTTTKQVVSPAQPSTTTGSSSSSNSA
jgi:hypothetical protein